jgi:hypothetical protein
MLHRSTVFLAALLIAIAFGGFSCAGAGLSSKDLLPTPAPPSPDAGPSELVAYFYKVLLQKEEPTLVQETILFGKKSLLNYSLIAWKKGKEGEPIILRYLRQHRDWFVPQGQPSAERCITGVRISSPFNFVRNVPDTANMKSHSEHGRCWVMVMFNHDDSAKFASERSVAIPFEEYKIEAEMIELGGFDGKMVGEKLDDENFAFLYLLRGF